jgi:peptide-methionine (S)-S-oxide reductase
MRRFHFRILAIVPFIFTLACNVASATVAIPDPVIDAPLAAARGEQIAVLAGGCFWGIQAVYKHVRGVTDAKSGYCGGDAKSAEYEIVSSGNTGHAESVLIKYDPSQISYGQLLKIFFSIAHNPTELNRQGPDIGTQYRSAIFCSTEEQKRIADAYIDQLNKAKVFDRRIVTEVTTGKTFYRAEDYHQDYAELHPDNPYIVMHDLPKLANLRKQFPNLYVKK